MPLPDYIDNSRYKLQTILKQLIEDENQIILDIATGFFRIEAWLRLEAAMNQLTSLRLLLGRDPTIRPAESDRIDLIRYFRRDIQKQLEEEELKADYKHQIDRIIAYLEQDHIQVRLYGATNGEFLHAKAYIFDLYHQILLLTRGGETYYREWGISNLKTYFQALAKGGVEITELLMQTMVRRSRQDVIRRQSAGEEIRINGKLIHFPKRQLEQFTYNFEDSFAGLYAGIGSQIDQLTLPAYNIKGFKKRKNRTEENEVKRNDALVALQKALYFKRFESSLIAFKSSITNQRNLRIDRLGTDYDELFIYNCFPEKGLEDLLGLVKRLQQRIATIDREVGLDGSVLGETISDKSLEELYKLKMADTDAEKQAILEELEQAADLVSLDEMRLPLLEFLQQASKELIDDIPYGIHSTWNKPIPHPDVDNGGIFLAFRANDKHFWHFYPRINGFISLDPARLISDKRTIFNWLKCKESDFPHPDDLPPVEFNNQIFPVLERAIGNLMIFFEKQQTAKSIKPQMSKLLQNIYQALTQPDLFQSEPVDEEAKERVLKVITTVNYRSYERDIKSIWEHFKSHKNVGLLVAELDEYFVESDQYAELEDEQDIRPIEIIKRKDIKLICYQWFKPNY